jgi:hypothetical protein
MDLLTSIQQDIISNQPSFASALRKAKILAYKLDNQEFKRWIDYELNGYPGEGMNDEEFLNSIPNYRKAPAEIRANAASRFHQYPDIPLILTDFPNYLKVFFFEQGIPSLEKLVQDQGEMVRSNFPDRILLIINSSLESEDLACSRAWKQVPKFMVVQLLETVKDRLLSFTLELRQAYPNLPFDDKDIFSTQVSSEKVSQIFHVTISKGGSMFNQSGQTVQGNQYNAAGDINFENVSNRDEFASMLEKLQHDLDASMEVENLDEDVITDVEYHMKKAVQQANKPEPEKEVIQSHLGKVKDLIKGTVGLSGVIVAIGKAIEVIDKFI